jgi:SAM-dependent methyltransferase
MTDRRQPSEQAALRGEPSYVWRAGQIRRLNMIRSAAGDRLKGRILEAGCGVGAYLTRLATSGSLTVGLEIELERATQAVAAGGVLVCGAGEGLPFCDNYFDLVLSHEVLEHVQDDRKSLEEIVRVLQPGGRLLLFVPNRGYPFETHGFYWRNKYHFGNIPLINYLPRGWRNRLAPHVRVYSPHDLIKLLKGLPVCVIHRRVIFGAYDNVIARLPFAGRIVRSLLQALEKTPLQGLGLSHFWVIEKNIEA